MEENTISNIIIDCSLKIYKYLGPGLLESVYERILAYELKKTGMTIQQQVPIPIKYDIIFFDEGYRADIIVNNIVLIELKSVSDLIPIHYKQVLSYLKLSGIKLGLLINFNTGLLKQGIKRVANGVDNLFPSRTLRSSREK